MVSKHSVLLLTPFAIQKSQNCSHRCRHSDRDAQRHTHVTLLSLPTLNRDDAKTSASSCLGKPCSMPQWVHVLAVHVSCPQMDQSHSQCFWTMLTDVFQKFIRQVFFLFSPVFFQAEQTSCRRWLCQLLDYCLERCHSAQSIEFDTHLLMDVTKLMGL